MVNSNINSLGGSGKLYFTIGEVSRITGLPASVLRYWETEFNGIRPPRNRAGKRIYRQSEIDRILRIKKLLYEDRFTIEGARNLLKEETAKSSQSSRNPQPGDDKSNLFVDEIRGELKEILRLLDE